MNTTTNHIATLTKATDNGTISVNVWFERWVVSFETRYGIRTSTRYALCKRTVVVIGGQEVVSTETRINLGMGTSREEVVGHRFADFTKGEREMGYIAA